MTDERNEMLRERLEDARTRIREIPDEHTVPEPFRDYFVRTADFLLSVSKDADNRSLYEDILPANYAASYANPDYAAEKLGVDYGPYLSAVYAELRGLIPAVFEDDAEGQAVLLELFLTLYFEFEGGELPRAEAVRHIFAMYLRDYTPSFVRDQIGRQLLPERSFAADIIRNADFAGTDYLYAFGEYVTEDTVRTAAFINSLPEETIAAMADTFTEGYRLGFVNAGKDLSRKKTVQVVFELGFERVIAAAFRNFEKMGLLPTAVRSSVRLVTKSPNRHAGYTGAVPNEQFDYDHRYDLTYFMNKPLLDRYIVCTRLAYEKYSQKATVYAGPACIEVFGEKPFVPKQKKYAISPDAKAMKLLTSYNQERSLLLDEFINLSTTSFTIIAYPIPEIGEDFKEIFDETVRINTLDKELYRNIQERLIEELNKGVGAKIKGMNGNATDIYVAFASLDDPATQTVFENCLADVNIPVGEVFTSPKLKGTSGVLNASRVYLNELEYKNLTVTFEDGMIKDYNCTNFDDEERCKKYIEENVLFGHPSLPMGEFAIGTNTAAYVMARKYNIADKLPILIAEKTGPHFAVGDTCYSMSEENRVYNPDGKEIIAKDNEVSILRKTDIEKAYFNCHTDITIPYDELGFIDVIHEDGSTVRLIDNGRFVLAGTEKLNDELDKL